MIYNTLLNNIMAKTWSQQTCNASVTIVYVKTSVFRFAEKKTLNIDTVAIVVSNVDYSSLKKGIGIKNKK